MKKLIPLLFLAALAGGCTSTHYKNGEIEFSRTSFLNKQSIGEVDLVAGEKKLKIKGYTNEQTEVAAAVAGAVASAYAAKADK